MDLFFQNFLTVVDSFLIVQTHATGCSADMVAGCTVNQTFAELAEPRTPLPPLRRRFVTFSNFSVLSAPFAKHASKDIGQKQTCADDTGVGRLCFDEFAVPPPSPLRRLEPAEGGSC